MCLRASRAWKQFHLLHPRDTVKPDVAGGCVDRLWKTRRRTIPAAVVGRAEVRATLEHPAGNSDPRVAARQAGVLPCPLERARRRTHRLLLAGTIANGVSDQLCRSGSRSASSSRLHLAIAARPPLAPATRASSVVRRWPVPLAWAARPSARAPTDLRRITDHQTETSRRPRTGTGSSSRDRRAPSTSDRTGRTIRPRNLT
jgi:hypothetical protein